jgi:hypothetical protein|tara:strand:+ start:249 stop:392 length:144 start_codon:yes stop_codon:yes gene_type:complete
MLSKYLGSILAAEIILAAVKNIESSCDFYFHDSKHDWPWPTPVEKIL